MSPDEFLCDLLETHEETGSNVLEQAVRTIKGRLKNPPMSWNQYFERLRRNGLTRTVEYLQEIISRDEVAADDDKFKAPSAPGTADGTEGR